MGRFRCPEHTHLRTTVLGQAIRFPIMLDPAGNHAATHPDGELASARAAGAAGTILVLSAQSSRTLEEVAQTATGPLAGPSWLGGA